MLISLIKYNFPLPQFQSLKESILIISPVHPCMSAVTCTEMLSHMWYAPSKCIILLCYVYECLHMSASLVCQVPTEAKRMCLISMNWSYSKLCKLPCRCWEVNPSANTVLLSYLSVPHIIHSQKKKNLKLNYEWIYRSNLGILWI